jgi:hypothetical protein
MKLNILSRRAIGHGRLHHFATQFRKTELMKATWTLIAAALAILAVGLALPAEAQKSPEKIRLAPNDKQGAVLVRVDKISADYMLRLQKSGSGGFGSRVYVIPVEGGGQGEAFVARTLTPGRYRLDSLIQQRAFLIALSADTVEFEIAPGKIAYLGKLNSLELLIAMQRAAVAAGKTRAQIGGGGGFNSDEGLAKPVFSGRDAAGLAEAETFAGRVMSARPEQVLLADLHETHFQK